jgi:hypothetical protein
MDTFEELVEKARDVGVKESVIEDLVSMREDEGTSNEIIRQGLRAKISTQKAANQICTA